MSGYFTQQAGLARIDDLRREAEHRRLVALAREHAMSPEPGRSSGRRPRWRALSLLRAGRATTA